MAAEQIHFEVEEDFEQTEFTTPQSEEENIMNPPIAQSSPTVEGVLPVEVEQETFRLETVFECGDGRKYFPNFTKPIFSNNKFEEFDEEDKIATFEYLNKVAKAIKFVMTNTNYKIEEGNLIYKYIKPFNKEDDVSWEDVDFLKIDWLGDAFALYRILFLPKYVQERIGGIQSSVCCGIMGHNECAQDVVIGITGWYYERNRKKMDSDSVCLMRFLFDVFDHLIEQEPEPDQD